MRGELDDGAVMVANCSGEQATLTTSEMERRKEDDAITTTDKTSSCATSCPTWTHKQLCAHRWRVVVSGGK
jgi:hypothetical protein